MAYINPNISIILYEWSNEAIKIKTLFEWIKKRQL